jgi:hypothetical protein
MPMRPNVFFKIGGRGDVRAALGLRREANGGVQTLAQVAPDGDTLQANLEGSGSLRFLGVDAPEMSLKGVSVADERWRAFFADSGNLDLPGLEPDLRDDLAARFKPDAAGNHRRHAEQARAGLLEMIAADMEALGATPRRSASLSPSPMKSSTATRASSPS